MFKIVLSNLKMIINSSKFSKNLIIFLVYYLMILLTVTCAFETDQNVMTKSLATITTPTYQDNVAEDNDEEFDPKLEDNNDEEILTKQQICQIMGSIQLGIKHEIQSMTSLPELPFPDDFKNISIMKFKNWHDTNYNTQYPDFSFTTYAPFTFHYFRGLFGIDETDYVTSFCNKPLQKLSNSGASKSLFYLTPDDKFIMKTLQQTEDECLLKLLSTYTTYLTDHPESLLPKFSGFYGFQSKSTDVKLISMNNLIPSNIIMHQKFDLKGSTLGREASDNEKLKKSPTFKDLDFNNEIPNGIFLKPDTRSALLETIKRDCNILKEFNIMDYSLLMGVHNIDHPLNTEDDTSSNTYALRLATEAWWESLMGDSVGEKSLQSDAGTFSDENYASLRRSIPAKSVNGDRLLLFVGIIDILQTFRITKNMERSFKSIKLKLTPGTTERANSISVQPPEFYATRFINYMTDTVFKPMLSPEELDELSKQSIDIPLSRKRSSSKIIVENLTGWFKKPKTKEDDS